MVTIFVIRGSLSNDEDDVAKTSLKECIHAVSKSIVLIARRSIWHLMLVSFSEVELQKTLSKFKIIVVLCLFTSFRKGETKKFNVVVV